MQINAVYNLTTDGFLKLINKRDLSINIFIKSILDFLCKDEISCMKKEIIELSQKSNRIKIFIKTIYDKDEIFIIEDHITDAIFYYVINDNFPLKKIYEHMGIIEKQLKEETNLSFVTSTDNLLFKKEILFISITFLK
jgi:hypothetical protein